MAIEKFFAINPAAEQEVLDSMELDFMEADLVPAIAKAIVPMQQYNPDQPTVQSTQWRSY